MDVTVISADELAVLLGESACGRFPAPDWSLRLAPLCGPAGAVMAFTGCFAVSAPITADWLGNQLNDPDIGPLHPRLLLALAAGLDSPIGENDAVLAADPLPGPAPVALCPFDGEHPRLARARRYRDQLQAWTTASGDGMLVLGKGLAGRWEMSIEVFPYARGRGLGRALAIAARHHAPTSDPVFAQVTPGNAASLRTLLAAGYRPVAQEVLFTLRTGDMPQATA